MVVLRRIIMAKVCCSTTRRISLAAPPRDVGAVLKRADDLEAQVAKLKAGDIEKALTLQKELNDLDAMIASLEAKTQA